MMGILVAIGWVAVAICLFTMTLEAVNMFKNRHLSQAEYAFSSILFGILAVVITYALCNH